MNRGQVIKLELLLNTLILLINLIRALNAKSRSVFFISSNRKMESNSRFTEKNCLTCLIAPSSFFCQVEVAFNKRPPAHFYLYI